MDESVSHIAKAPGQRSVSISGNVKDTFIITGDIRLSLNQDGAFHFHLMDEDFRDKMQNSTPAAFYDGIRANWANIAKKDDADRALYSDVWNFVENQDLSAQRMGIILGLAGEGKTTLLMRLAWDLAEDGYTVFWRHSGLAFPTSKQDFQTSNPIVLCFDQADQESDLPMLARNLSESGVPFIILGTSIYHEWHNANLETPLRRSMYLQSFNLTRLKEFEVNSLLDCLAEANKLDALANLSRSSQVSHFMDKLKADGQLLPALLTARSGAENFESIIKDVLIRVQKRQDGEKLILAYSLLASVHRFGYWLSRSLYAQILGIPEQDVGLRVLGPLKGELIEINEDESDKLFTRNSIIADRVAQLVENEKWAPEMRYLYQTILEALAEHLIKKPDDPQRKLLTILPLAFIRRGDIATSRRLFQEGTRIDSENAYIWQPWAIMEKEQGNIKEARELFEKGTEADPKNAHLWQAWAIMEKEQGDIKKARELFEKGTEADPKNAHLWQAWAIMEKEQGDIKKARELFKMGAEADPKNAPLWQAWAELETLCANIGDINTEFCARWLFKKATNANPNDPLCWTQWAELERNQDNWSQAEQFYLNAAGNENNLESRARIYSDLSSMFGYIKNNKKSNEYLLLSIEANPNDHIAHARLGRNYGFQREWDKSDTHFQLSLNIRSNDHKTQKWYADMQRAREHHG